MPKTSDLQGNCVQQRGEAASQSRRTFMRSAAIGSAAVLGAPYIAGRSALAAGSMHVVHFAEAVHNLGYIDLYVARDKGFFREQGIDFRLTAAGGDSQAFAAVLSRSAEFGCGDSTLCEISREQGGPGVVLGELVSRAQYFGVSKKISKPITNPVQFKGLTFVTSPPPNTNYDVLVRTLKQAGLNPTSDVKIITVNPGTEIGPVLAGQADVAVAYEPNVDEAVVGAGAHVIFSWAAYVGPFHNTGMYALPEYVKANPHVVQGMANALQKGILYTYKYPEQAKAVARKEFPHLKPEVVNAAIERQLKNSIPSATLPVSKVGWEALIKLGVQLGHCKGTIPFDQIVDNSFAQRAVKTVKVEQA